MAKSIREFGFGAPIVARAENLRVIAGHTRLKAALKLGLELVPVRLLDISEADADRLALADNKLGELAEWDQRILDALVRETGVDLKDLGWTAEDVAGLGAGRVDADEIPLNDDLGGVEDEPTPRFQVTVPASVVSEFKRVFRDHMQPMGVMMRPVK